MDRILSLIKKIIPRKLFKIGQPIYHWCLAKTSALFYGYPSEKMVVVGVTGTAGKSSTCYFIAQVLEKAGLKVGMITTTLFKIADKEWLNDKKMTMLGRFAAQKMLKSMVQKKCKVAIIESSSQGVEQFRHIGINYDVLVFTNLYPEHIEAHGSFENYKRAKGKLFAYLKTTNNKQLTVNNKKIKKTIIVNTDDEHSDYFLSFDADEKKTFQVPDSRFQIPLLGDYNKYNVAAAVAVAEALGVENPDYAALKPMPGRLEFIENDLGINIIVDYAFEPKAMEKLYNAVQEVPHKKIIHILGSAGGGRDKARRPILGKMAAEKADLVIVTNEDPYDEDPKAIISDVVSGAMDANFQFPISNFQKNLKFQNSKNKNIYAILDRREAIKKALSLAEEGDLLIVTGKGAEQAICIANGKKIPWDDRKIIQEELNNI